MILYQLVAAAVGDRLRDRWPDSPRAQAIGYWLPMMATVFAIVVLVGAVVIAIARAPAGAIEGL